MNKQDIKNMSTEKGKEIIEKNLGRIIELNDDLLKAIEKKNKYQGIEDQIRSSITGIDIINQTIEKIYIVGGNNGR